MNRRLYGPLVMVVLLLGGASLYSAFPIHGLRSIDLHLPASLVDAAIASLSSVPSTAMIVAAIALTGLLMLSIVSRRAGPKALARREARRGRDAAFIARRTGLAQDAVRSVLTEPRLSPGTSFRSGNKLRLPVDIELQVPQTKPAPGQRVSNLDRGGPERAHRLPSRGAHTHEWTV